MPDARPRIVGVRFPNAGKINYFDSAGMRLDVGEYVVVHTIRGPELARVVIAPDEVVVDEMRGDDLPPVLRPAGGGDIQRASDLALKASETLIAARRLASDLGFGATIQKAEYTLDGQRLTLHFESSDRVDYREFARRASREFDCRIDMHNLGPRDRARLAGGYGICGRELCCASWLQTFPSISIRMAKEQDKPLNPEKISGLCGRLLCCLSYEEEGYKEMRRTLPRLGHRVSTPTGEGRVVNVNILRRSITISIDGQRFDVPDRDLGTVVRWDPAAKTNEPPPSISRAQGIEQGLVEADSLDDDPATADWPPRTARYGRLPVQAPTGRNSPPPLKRETTDEQAPKPAQEQRAPRRRRRGSRSSQAADAPDQPQQTPRATGRTPRRPANAETPPAGRSRVFRRQDAADAPSGQDRPRRSAGDQEPPGQKPPSSEGTSRRRGRRGGRRRRGNSGGGDSASE
ncbi:MAG: regulatory iron-sulfur-containing complex subunit RicT [Dehalococcoidia bacterium]